MKPLITLAFIFYSACLSAQDNLFTDFGFPSSTEMEMTRCSFDSEADAVILSSDAVSIPDELKMFTYHRIRIKILKQGGLSHADIKIPYYHGGEAEYITGIHTVVVNKVNGELQRTTVKAKEIYTKKIDENYSVVSFAFPDVRVGSVIEYYYTKVRKYFKVIDYWYFQHDLPVVKSSYKYTVSPKAEFAYRVLKSEKYPIDLKVDNSSGTLFFQMNNLPGVPDEPFMDSRNDYLQRVELQLTNYGSGLNGERFVENWKDANSKLLRDDEFGAAISKSIAGTASIVKTALLLKDKTDRIPFIYNAVKKQLSWNGYYGIFASDKLKKAWDAGNGSTGDINLTLINLLKAAEVDVFPLLVSTRRHGRIDMNHAFLGQFNKVIALVVSGTKKYFLDASAPQMEINLIPIEFLNTHGFIIDQRNSGFVRIEDDQHFEKRLITLSGKVTGEGILNAETHISESDYARVMSKKNIAVDLKSWMKEKYFESYASVSLDSVSVQNLEHDSLPLLQKVNFRHSLKNTSGYLIVDLKMFSGFEVNPFISGNRYTDINFGCRKQITLMHSLNLDNAIRVESLPENKSLLMSDSSIRYTRQFELSPDQRRITSLIKIEFLKPLYEAGNYTALREYYKKLFALLDEPIVLKKAG